MCTTKVNGLINLYRENAAEAGGAGDGAPRHRGRARYLNYYEQLFFRTMKVNGHIGLYHENELSICAMKIEGRDR